MADVCKANKGSGCSQQDELCSRAEELPGVGCFIIESNVHPQQREKLLWNMKAKASVRGSHMQ